MAIFDLEIVHQQKDEKPSTVWTSVSYRTEMLMSPTFHDGGLYPRPHAVSKATRSGLCPWEDTLRGKVRSIKQHLAPRFLRHGRSYVFLPHPPCLRWRGPGSDQ